jgi:predicted dehydrogenase
MASDYQGDNMNTGDIRCEGEITRRRFLQTTAASGAAVVFAESVLANTLTSLSSKKRYAIVGVGARTRMWQDGLYRKFQDTSEVVGFCDTNLGRLKLYQDFAKKATGKSIPTYEARDFDKMISDTKPDAIIVTTVDSFHHQYIVRAMQLGCDVITEKPMTNTDEKCRQIIDAQKRYGKSITVSFNYRYSPARTQVKELLMSGVIGDVLSTDFHWMLNTHHGTDYFRRWHSMKQYSNGLLLHKATHHFDLMNWWLSAVPVSVTAMGKKEFYTPEMAKRFGLSGYHERCHTCPEKAKCGFELDLAANPNLKALYLDNEQYDGYFRDRCVFRPEIDIEDTMNVLVTYSTKVTMSYSLNAFNSWEGYYVVFNGTKGRLEHKIEETVYVAGDGGVQGGIRPGGENTKIFPIRGAAYDVEVWKGQGGHGGGDDIMLKDIFGAVKAPDKYLRCADQRAGAYSLLTGVAANHSMSTGKEVKIDDLVQNIGMPDYPPMPSHSDVVPMPDKKM